MATAGPNGSRAETDVQARDPRHWLQDHDDYLDGRISYDELRQRNCERYRDSPPICVSGGLADSQREWVPTGDGPVDAVHTDDADRRPRRVRWSAVLLLVLVALGFLSLGMFIVMHEWFWALFLVGPLWTATLDAMALLQKQRDFDDG